MHQTTLRFPQDLWDFLEQEAKGLGVSIAQYVREAALARAAYDAGRRGDPGLLHRGLLGSEGRGTSDEGPAREQGVLGAMAHTDDPVSASSAVWAEAKLVRRRSELLVAQAREAQAPRRATRMEQG